VSTIRHKKRRGRVVARDEQKGSAVTTIGQRRVTGALLAFLIAGCGLADYEQQMHATQDRVERFKEESEVLGDPISIPTMREPQKDSAPPATPPKPKDGGKDQKGGKDSSKDASKEKRVYVIQYPFFLRLPRGIRTTPDNEPRGELAYRYPRANAPAAKPGEPPAGRPGDQSAGASAGGFFEVYLAFGNEAAPTFADKVTRVFPHSTEGLQASMKDVTVPERKQPMNFAVREFNDGPTSWAVYAHTEGVSTVAIAFHMDKAQKANLSRVIELSLATLAMGQEATFVKASYDNRSRK
jgi:hypothetical protein